MTGHPQLGYDVGTITLPTCHANTHAPLLPCCSRLLVTGHPQLGYDVGTITLPTCHANTHAPLLPCCSRLLVTGHPQLGYDIGTITSLGLLATAYPAARATGDAYSVAMTALGGGCRGAAQDMCICQAWVGVSAMYVLAIRGHVRTGRWVAGGSAGCVKQCGVHVFPLATRGDGVRWAWTVPYSAVQHALRSC